MEPVVPRSTIPELLARHARERGDHPAVMSVPDTVTYAELEQRTAKMARAFLALGAGKGTRMALLAPDGVFWITTWLAALRIGALLTTVSTLATPPELAYILRNSDVQILIAARKFLRHDYGVNLTAALPRLAESKVGAIKIVAAPFLRSVWMDDPSGLSWAGSVGDLIARADAPDATLLAAVEKEVVPSDDAVIVYTSGSTSTPKAVIHSQGNLTSHGPELARIFMIKPTDRMMPLLPAFWAAGMAMATKVLCTGATLVYPESPDLEVVADTVARFKANRMNFWGGNMATLRDMIEARGVSTEGMFAPGPYRDARGEMIPSHLQATTFGMTETFSCHSGEPLNVRMADDKAGAAGRAVNNYERRIVNLETGEVAPFGEVGEMQVRGGALMSGFYKVERRKVFTPDGFYPTGDLSRMDADGYSYYIGRRGDMIKTKGANVSRLEVEAAMRNLPDVDLPIVVGLPDPDIGQVVVAAVVPKSGATLTEEGLRNALRGTISSFKIPRHICFIAHEDVPRTTTGKLKLHELAGMISGRLGR